MSTVEAVIEELGDKFVIAPDGCWLWVGKLGAGGYARTAHRGQGVQAHRLVYQLARGEIPEGLELDHLCRVRHCVNPAHLEPVTHRENVLRGDGLAAVHARKTHCKNDHEFTPENTRIDSRGWRSCRRCRHDKYVQGYTKCPRGHELPKDQEGVRRACPICRTLPPDKIPAWYPAWEIWKRSGSPRGKRPADAPKRIPAWAWEKLARPSPAELAAHRVMFFANVADDAVQHFCRLPASWKAAITADPAYAPTLEQVNALKNHGTVYAWGNQEQIPAETILNFQRDWNLDGAIFQAESEAEFESAMNQHPTLVVGNPNAWTADQRAEFTEWKKTHDVALIAEVYNGRPDIYSSQGVPVAAFLLGVAMDDGLHYPLTSLMALTPAPFDRTFGCWHAAGLLPSEWAALEAIG